MTQQMQDLDEQYRGMPMKSLRRSARLILARHLTIETQDVNVEGFTKDWQGLAEMMNYDTNDIENFQNSPNPTSVLLSSYEKKSGATLGSLWDCLVNLGRFDILEDPSFKYQIEHGVAAYRTREQQRQEEYNQAVAKPVGPVQDPRVSSGDHYEQIDMSVDEYQEMVVQDVGTGLVTKFDAFVSYAHGSKEDLSFVKEMIRILEDVHHLKLCVAERDLIGGGAKHNITAKLIADRCYKVIIVLSPDFLQSQECDFQTKFAFSLSPGSRRKLLIPIKFRPCSTPDILRFVTTIYYTRFDLIEWFWTRLRKSIQANSQATPFAPDDDVMSLAGLEYEIPSVDSGINPFTQIEEEEEGGTTGDSYPRSSTAAC